MDFALLLLTPLGIMERQQNRLSTQHDLSLTSYSISFQALTALPRKLHFTRAGRTRADAQGLLKVARGETPPYRGCIQYSTLPN